MGQHSSIEWTHHTHNLWWGCFHISPACDNCYADGQAHHRLPFGWIIIGEGLKTPRRTKFADTNRPEIWGAKAPRLFPPIDGDYVRAPFKWDRDAVAIGERHRVFVSSMCDIFERHSLAEVRREMDARRDRFFEEIVPVCTSLDFLLLTKRPHDIMRLVPRSWRTSWPMNVWVGCTVEDQQRARQRLPNLIEVPAPVRFISGEPLLGPLDLSAWIDELDWVIAGGESGAHARPPEIGWMRSLRDQTKAARTSFHFKQWGNHAQSAGNGNVLIRLRTKNFRLLDGRTWDEVPMPRRGR